MMAILYFGFGHGAFLTFLAMAKSGKQRPHYFLICLLCLLTGAYGLVLLALEINPNWLLFTLNLNLIITPCFYLYVTSLTGSLNPGWRPLFPHLLPYFLSWVVILILGVAFTNADWDRWFYQENARHRPLALHGLMLTELLIVPIYLFLVNLELKAYRERIAQDLSYGHGVDLRWIVILTRILLGFWLFISLPDFLNFHYQFMSETTILQFSFALGTPLIFVLGFCGLKQQTVFSNLPETGKLNQKTAKIPEPKYKRSGLKQEEITQGIQELKLLMTSTKPFLDPKLSAGDLARRLGVSNHRLSQIINEAAGVSFYRFINRYRVEAFKEALETGKYPHMNLMGVALESGFNSKSSFNRIFKKETGVTPKQFARSLTSKDKN